MSISLVRQEANRVHLIINGKLVANMPWQAADELRDALRIQARAAEEHEKADQIISDGAMLLRAGVRIGLTDNPKMQQAIINEAVGNTTLRRNIRPLQGVASQEILGLPRVYRQTDLDAMTPENRAKALGQMHPDLTIRGKSS